LTERRRVLAFLFGSTLLITASAVPRRVLGEERDAELARFASRGYEAAATTTTVANRDVWKHGNDEIMIELLLPSNVAQAPLVIYLPGLGEPVEAGDKWRNGWAQAGYAVASMQIAGSAALWSTSAGRNGDFKRAANEQFAVKSLNTRLERLNFVLREIAHRVQAGDATYGRIDTARVAVAGFDLGAQTALAVAGEKHPGMSDLPVMPGLRAAIALSPQAILARGGFVERFGTIHLPTLTVTGTEDGDPYGLVDSPHTRQAPFNYMPRGDKYLLVMEDGTHQLLAGAGHPVALQGEDANGAPEEFLPGGGRGGPPGGMGRSNFGGGPGGTGGPGGRGGPGGEDGPGSMGRPPPDRSAFQRFAAKALLRQIVIIERISVAFLDATVKDDPVAREWLARDATRWSDPLARLEMK
jgi:predicted dienelactone hydrolase